jgi:hypothetical protein
MTPTRNIATDATNAQRTQAIERQVRVWVSQTFFGTLLKQMHNSPFKSELFSGGRGGQAFSSLLDQRLSERMAGGAAKPLVDGIVRHIQRTNRAVQS